MDEVDFAAESMEAFNHAAIQALRERRNVTVSTGFCKSCGEVIEEERLAANPSALHCCDCAAEEEEKRKRAKLCGPA